VRGTFLAALAFSAVLGACDGEGGGTDAGRLDAGAQPIGLTVLGARYAMVVAGMAARGGYHYVILDVTLEARGVGPLAVAPNAFTLVLEDGTRATGQAMATDAIENGCTSRSVPLGSSVSCSVVFEVAQGAAAPRTLVWSDRIRTVSAEVPPAA
jgi:hypothetical protein